MDRKGIRGDLLVADFTDYKSMHPEEQLPSNGVCFLDAPDARVGSFCFLNPSHYPFDAINLEEHPALVGRDGVAGRNVECICNADRENGRRWVAFLELKYPRCEDNIPGNMVDAFGKFEECVKMVMEDNKYLEGVDCNIYAIASHPEFEQTQPFGAFICNQDRLLSLADKGITLIYGNAVRIATPEFLFLAKTPARYKFTRNKTTRQEI